MKKSLLLFSDCFTYSGSELVIENILKSEKITNHFNVNFVYGFSQLYDRRLQERMKYLGVSKDSFKSVSLLTPDTIIRPRIYQGSKWSLNYFMHSIFFMVLRGLKFTFISHIINFFTLRNRFRKASADIIFINNGGYPASLQCILAVFVARSLNIGEIYFNINNMAMDRSKWYHGIMDQLVNRFVTKFITASYAAQEQAILVRRFNRDAFVRIPNTVFNDLVISKKYVSKCKSDLFQFGAVGLLTERKGFHVLIRAIEIMVNQYRIRNFRLVLIGEGEEKESLESLVSKLEIRDYVSFMNYVAHPFETMCEFDVFVLPSIRNEDFPYVILESMVLGKPVIGTLVAGIPEQIENQVSGLLVEPNNPLELAKAMCASMEDEFTSNCGVNAKAKYFNEFSYDKVEGMYFDLFRNFN